MGVPSSTPTAPSNASLVVPLTSYANYIDTNAVSYPIYLNLQSELGNATTWSPSYVIDVANDYLPNEFGQSVIQQLLQNLLSFGTSSISTAQLTKVCNTRVAIAKYVNNQQIYSINSSQSYNINYDVKYDVTVPANTLSYTSIGMSLNSSYNFMFIVPQQNISVQITPSGVSAPNITMTLLANMPNMLFMSFTNIQVINPTGKSIDMSVILGNVT
jgi:hypothetical protein